MAYLRPNSEAHLGFHWNFHFIGCTGGAITKTGRTERLGKLEGEMGSQG
jgi:hypothetical protein